MFTKEQMMIMAAFSVVIVSQVVLYFYFQSQIQTMEVGIQQIVDFINQAITNTPQT